MKLIRSQYPRVRVTPKKGNNYFAVDLRRKHYQGPKFKWFKDREEALKYASEIGDKVAHNGIDSISIVGVDPRIRAWSEQFAVYNKTIEEAIDTALAVFEKERQVKESPYMADRLPVVGQHSKPNCETNL